MSTTDEMTIETEDDQPRVVGLHRDEGSIVLLRLADGRVVASDHRMADPILEALRYDEDYADGVPIEEPEGWQIFGRWK